MTPLHTWFADAYVQWCAKAEFIGTVEGVDIWRYPAQLGDYYGVRSHIINCGWAVKGSVYLDGGIDFPQPVIDFCLAHAALAS